jgi:hypothetical protein
MRRQRLFLLLFLCLLPSTFAWTGNSHSQAAGLAAERMSGTLGQILRTQREALLRGAVAPDREFHDFLNHVYHPKNRYGGGLKTCAAQLARVQSLVRKKARQSEIAFEMGVLSHYVSDLHNPLHTSGDDPREDKYHSAYEQAAERDLVSWKPTPKTPQMITAPESLVLGAVVVANKSYRAVGKAFSGGEGYSQVRGVTRALFAEAIHNIACLWLTAYSGKVKPVSHSYIGNKNSKIFHQEGCPSAAKMAAKNKIFFPTRAEAVVKGYRPCKNCRP